MSTSQRTSSTQPVGAPPSGSVSLSLPNLNEGKYSFDVVFSQLELAAYLNMYAVSDRAQSDQGRSGLHGVSGMPVSFALHRFHIGLRPPDSLGVRAVNTVGEVTGKLTDRWVVIPEGFSASPALEPPPMALDPKRCQRFAMQKSEFVFGDGKDGFRGFGTGRTYPTQGGPSRLLAGAVGDILEGYGRFRDLKGNLRSERRNHD